MQKIKRTPEKVRSDPYATELQKYFSCGLLAIALVFIQNFGGAGPLDSAGSIAIVAFAISFPLLGGTLILRIVENKFQYGPRTLSGHLTQVGYIVGVIAAFIGSAAALWHILPMAGIAFVFTTVVTFPVFGRYILHLEERPEGQDDK